jgi:hypothetical protein
LFGGNGEVWLIDHGHSFTGPNWQPGQLDPDAEYANRLSEWLTVRLSTDQKLQRAKEARNLGANIATLDLVEASANSRVTDLLPQAHLEALKRFLEKRVANIPIQASKALGVPILVP